MNIVGLKKICKNDKAIIISAKFVKDYPNICTDSSINKLVFQTSSKMFSFGKSDPKVITDPARRQELRASHSIRTFFNVA